jgi:hypothetical protein
MRFDDRLCFRVLGFTQPILAATKILFEPKGLKMRFVISLIPDPSNTNIQTSIPILLVRLVTELQMILSLLNPLAIMRITIVIRISTTDIRR